MDKVDSCTLPDDIKGAYGGSLIPVQEQQHSVEYGADALALIQSYSDQISDFLVLDVANTALPCQMAKAAHNSLRQTELQLYLTFRELQIAQMGLYTLAVACTECRIQQALAAPQRTH